MGLDMYLSRKRYIQNWDFMGPEERHEVTVTKNGEPVPLVNPKYIIEGIGYWRKANAIHNWFVRNVQDGVDECQEAYVDSDKLYELAAICDRILADNSLATTLLPTGSGFFFGGTQYEEYYFEVIRDTREILKIALDDTLHDGIYYQSSW